MPNLGRLLPVLALVTASLPAIAAPVAPAAPALPAPSMTLVVAPGKGGAPWTMKIENTGAVPIRLSADPRLLVIELTPAADTTKKGAKAPATLTCRLPDDARPSSDEGRDLVIPGKRSWTATFDPFFYCFGAKERAALVSGTTAKARFGWPQKPPAKGAKPVTPTPPFALAPVGAAVGQVAPAKEIQSADFTLTESVTIAAPTPPPAAPTPGAATATPATSSNDAPSPVGLTMSETMDASRGVELSAVVTLENKGDRAITLLHRAETVLFTVSGPAGSVACGNARIVASPIRELFITLGPKGKSSLSVLINAICPSDTFDEPGIYRVLPRIDTRNASGRPIGLRTWDGEAAGTTPLLLRVRNPRKPDPNAKRPALD